MADKGRPFIRWRPLGADLNRRTPRLFRCKDLKTQYNSRRRRLIKKLFEVRQASSDGLRLRIN